MPVTLSRVHHVGIIVRDIEASMAFYNKLFGKKPDIRTDVANSAGMSRQFGVGAEPGDASGKFAFYHIDNTSIELIEVLNPKTELEQLPVYATGAKHICFQVEDIEESYNAMVAEGYEFQAAPAFFDENQPALDGVRFAYFFDPDGNFLEIMQDPGKKGYIGREPRAGLEPG